jgi:hypothetical protein
MIATRSAGTAGTILGVYVRIDVVRAARSHFRLRPFLLCPLGLLLRLLGLLLGELFSLFRTLGLLVSRAPKLAGLFAAALELPVARPTPAHDDDADEDDRGDDDQND